jgi:hypothetical protein
MTHNDKFRQGLSVLIESNNHENCIDLTKPIKKQCDAWNFCVNYTEYKSARKGPVLKREIMIYQIANSYDTIIFKEALRRLCMNLEIFYNSNIKFIDRGSIPYTEN